MTNLVEWKFTPYNLNGWNSSPSRVMLIATEPNGGNPHGDILDMGEWFRTATQSNNYHGNKMFYNRCRMILNGIIGNESNSNFNHFRFIDLKATPGGASSNKIEITDYLMNNMHKVMEYFVSTNENFGKSPHIVVLLGNSAYELFSKYLRASVINRNPNLQWVQMPHPSAQTVANNLLSIACTEIAEKLVSIEKAANKWFCRGKLNSGWRKA
ncbi:MAG: uracil-DNA glycosylase family protein [Desulfobacterales bacterium]|nr:uracil-DNA glycosylase family protein [Desulfobacterales bacterium]